MTEPTLFFILGALTGIGMFLVMVLITWPDLIVFFRDRWLNWRVNHTGVIVDIADHVVSGDELEWFISEAKGRSVFLPDNSAIWFARKNDAVVFKMRWLKGSPRTPNRSQPHKKPR